MDTWFDCFCVTWSKSDTGQITSPPPLQNTSILSATSVQEWKNFQLPLPLCGYGDRAEADRQKTSSTHPSWSTPFDIQKKLLLNWEDISLHVKMILPEEFPSVSQPYRWLWGHEGNPWTNSNSWSTRWSKI